MDNQKGFSLLETIIALLLMSTASLTLLSWQLKATKILQRSITEARSLITLQNSYEAH
jgi:prepilin-type N-terminal cleavage/methylation domain-containing protein